MGFETLCGINFVSLMLPYGAIYEDGPPRNNSHPASHKFAFGTDTCSCASTFWPCSYGEGSGSRDFGRVIAKKHRNIVSYCGLRPLLGDSERCNGRLMTYFFYLFLLGGLFVLISR